MPRPAMLNRAAGAYQPEKNHDPAATKAGWAIAASDAKV
jgi:hypothetical protein